MQLKNRDEAQFSSMYWIITYEYEWWFFKVIHYLSWYRSDILIIEMKLIIVLTTVVAIFVAFTTALACDCHCEKRPGPGYIPGPPSCHCQKCPPFVGPWARLLIYAYRASHYTRIVKFHDPTPEKQPQKCSWNANFECSKQLSDHNKYTIS